MKTKTAIRAIAMMAAALILACILLLFAGCAPAESGTDSAADSAKKSEYAIVRLPDDTIIQGYVDYKYTDSVGAVRIEIDGTEYTTHWANVVVFDK